MQQAFQLKDILPNPYRPTNYLDSTKIDALVESIETTEFWENIVCRVNAKGQPELAYGHHRLAALRKVYPPTHRVNLLVRDLDDAAMIQIMDRENAQEYGNDAYTLVIGVRAVVNALAAGKISAKQMPRPGGAGVRKETLRYAPSFVKGAMSAADLAPYTADSVALFLGRTKKSGEGKRAIPAVIAALDLLELEEQGYISDARARGLTLTALQQIVSELQERRDQTERLKREAALRVKEAAAAAERKRQHEEAVRIALEKAAAARRAKEEAKAHEHKQIAEEAKARVQKDVQKMETATSASKQLTQQAAIVRRDTRKLADKIVQAPRATRSIQEAIRTGTSPAVRALTPISTLVLKFTQQVDTVFDNDVLWFAAKEIATRRKELGDADRKRLAGVLSSLTKRVKQIQNDLEEEQ